MKNFTIKISLYLLLFQIVLVGNAFAAADVSLSVNPRDLLIQLIVFIIALYILNSFILKPLVRVWDTRDKLTKGTVDEARKLTDEVDEIINNYNTKLEEARSEANDIRNELRRQGQAEADKILTASREQARKKLDEHRSKLSVEINEIKAKIQPEIELLAKDITSQILGKGA